MNLKQNRLYEEKISNQGCLMKIVECGDRTNITVEFQDEHKARVHTQYTNFQKGSVKNPYYPSICGVGIIGEKYPVSTNCITAKEYDAWRRMIVRCFNEWYKENRPAYKFVTVCDEWLNYENFYEWIHSQENFEQWYNGKRWAIDKDILHKGNKVYSPENCCLIPQNVNCLFLKRESERGKYPIGVQYTEKGFSAKCRNPFLNKAVELGYYSTPEKAFEAYKKYKENIIKQVAQEEYNKGNITKQCYDAMMKYEVEITD